MGKVIVNGEVDSPECLRYESYFDTPDRVIELPNIAIEFSRTKSGGWIEKCTSHNNPKGGGGTGHRLKELTPYNPWICEQLWRRVIELEDELRILKKGISYKEE